MGSPADTFVAALRHGVKLQIFGPNGGSSARESLKSVLVLSGHLGRVP